MEPTLDPTALLHLLPPEWLALLAEWTPRVLAVVGAATVLVPLLLPQARRLESWTRSTPARWDDAPARYLVIALEWTVVASSWLLTWVPRLTAGRPAARDAKIDERPRPKPILRPPGDGSLGLVLAAVVVSLLHTGCGASAFQTHARGAAIAATALSATGDVVDSARGVALDRVEEAHPARGPERDAALDAEAARWRPAGEALDAARTAVLTWIDAIELARIAGSEDGLLPQLVQLGARVVQLYDRVIAVIASLGVEGVPALPDAVRTFAEGLTGGAR